MNARAALQRLQREADPVVRTVWLHDGERLSACLAALSEADLRAAVEPDELTPAEMDAADAWLLQRVPAISAWADEYRARFTAVGWDENATDEDVLSDRYRDMKLPQPTEAAVREARALQREPRHAQRPRGVQAAHDIARYWAAFALELTEGVGRARPSGMGPQP